MSGGHWNYGGARIRDGLEAVARDDRAKERWPITCGLFGQLADVLYALEHDMDRTMSGDWSKGPSDEEMAGLVLTAVLRELPDEWFPRGKWATIQALQGRSGAPSVR